MRNQWPAYRIVGLSSGLLTTVGFIGLWICKVIREHLQMTEKHFMQTLYGRVPVWTLSGCFILGLVVLFPFALYLQNRAGVRATGPSVPAWILWPIKSLIVLLLLFLLMGVTYRILL